MKWEYTVAHYGSCGDDLESHLNEWGKDGWELVSAEEQRFIFKRQAPIAVQFSMLINNVTKDNTAVIQKAVAQRLDVTSRRL
jgi:hypothetical protein